MTKIFPLYSYRVSIWRSRSLSSLLIMSISTLRCVFLSPSTTAGGSITTNALSLRHFLQTLSIVLVVASKSWIRTDDTKQYTYVRKRTLFFLSHAVYSIFRFFNETRVQKEACEISAVSMRNITYAIYPAYSFLLITSQVICVCVCIPPDPYPRKGRLLTLATNQLESSDVDAGMFNQGLTDAPGCQGMFHFPIFPFV